MENNLLKQFENGKILSAPQYPRSVFVIPSSKCTLQCLHCYHPHNIKAKSLSSEEWIKIADQLSEWPSQIFYVGRILTAVGAEFIKRYCEKSGHKIGIVDNGTTILNFPELFQYYDFVDISLDGVQEDHDRQRMMAGSFDIAMNAIHKLRAQGIRVSSSSVLSKINIDRWAEFEKFCIDNKIPLSTSPIIEFPANKVRAKKILFHQDEFVKAFLTLKNGEPKLINLYSIEMLEALVPELKKLDWTFNYEKLRIETTLPNETKIFYRPLSILYLTEAKYLWDGRLVADDYMEDEKTETLWCQETEEQRLKTANSFLEKELRAWRRILDK